MTEDVLHQLKHLLAAVITHRAIVRMRHVH
jgi:hypothetical protein